jgi:hypothetical protein
MKNLNNTSNQIVSTETISMHKLYVEQMKVLQLKKYVTLNIKKGSQLDQYSQYLMDFDFTTLPDSVIFAEHTFNPLGNLSSLTIGIKNLINNEVLFYIKRPAYFIYSVRYLSSNVGSNLITSDKTAIIVDYYPPYIYDPYSVKIEDMWYKELDIIKKKKYDSYIVEKSIYVRFLDINKISAMFNTHEAYSITELFVCNKYNNKYYSLLLCIDENHKILTFFKIYGPLYDVNSSLLVYQNNLKFHLNCHLDCH